MSVGNLIKVINKLLPEIERLNANLERINALPQPEVDDERENRKSFNNGYTNSPKLK
jgi:hypothetical protein